MNDERKIARAIIDAQAMHESSYKQEAEGGLGEYELGIEECLRRTCRKNGLTPNMYRLLNLAMYLWNDIQIWAEEILKLKPTSKKPLIPTTPEKELDKAAQKYKCLKCDENKVQWNGETWRCENCGYETHIP